MFWIIKCVEHCWTSFVLLSLTQMVYLGESVVRNETWNTTCSDVMLVVNCSYHGIFIFGNTSHSDTFGCNSCRPRESCCDLFDSISLRITRFEYFINLNQQSKTGRTDVNRNNVKGNRRQYREYLIVSNYSITEYKNTEYLCHGDDMGCVSGFNGSYNNFVNIPRFDCWINLQWIDFSSNRITTLTRHETFGNLTSLKNLYLGNNSIHLTHPSALVHLSSLQYLYINDNPHIEDWSFLSSLSSLEIVDITGSCNQTVFTTDSFITMPCTNTTSFSYFLTFSNDSVFKSNIECRVLSEWPKTSLTLPFLLPCSDVGNTPLHSTSFLPTAKANSTTASVKPTLDQTCYFFSRKGTFGFFSSQKNCIWVPMAVLACVIMLCVAVVACIRWRHHVKRQGRYSRWLSVYSSQSSRGNKIETEKCSLEIKSPDL